MAKNKKADTLLYVFSEEKLDEFRHMPARARLRWLEEANAFINKVLGLQKRAEFDERFKGDEGIPISFFFDIQMSILSTSEKSACG